MTALLKCAKAVRYVVDSGQPNRERSHSLAIRSGLGSGHASLDTAVIYPMQAASCCHLTSEFHERKQVRIELIDVSEIQAVRRAGVDLQLRAGNEFGNAASCCFDVTGVV